MTLDENAFQTLADETLEALMERIDAARGDRLDVDLVDGVLTIELAPGQRFVVNKHAPSRQIWLSSPFSGATHFGYDEGRSLWVSTRGEETLAGMLAEELAAAAGAPLALEWEI